MVRRTLLTIDIFEAIKKSNGCLLCYLWVKYEKRLMQHLLTNEVVMSPEFRKRVLTAKGFCNHHMHLLYKTGYGHTTEGISGYTIYTEGVVRRIIESLVSLTNDNSANLKKLNDNHIIFRAKKKRQAFALLRSKVEQAVQGKTPCPACGSLWSSDEIHRHTLIQMLDHNDFREEFRSSKGLCIPHFTSAIRMISQIRLKNPIDVAQTLIEVEINNLELTNHYLLEFLRKQRWDYRNEPSGPEIDANAMVLDLLVGAEGFCHRNYNAISLSED